MVPTTSASGVVALNTASEAQLWSYLVQLTSALRCAHSAGLVLRPGCLHPTKVSGRGMEGGVLKGGGEGSGWVVAWC